MNRLLSYHLLHKNQKFTILAADDILHKNQKFTILTADDVLHSNQKFTIPAARKIVRPVNFLAGIYCGIIQGFNPN